MKIIRPMTPLRQRMLEDRQSRNYSPHTIDGYLRSVAPCAQSCHTSPAPLDAEPIRTYPLHLVQQQVSKSVCVQTVCARRFCSETPLGRPSMVDSIPSPKQPTTLPVILWRDEVKAVLLAPRPRKHRAMLAILSATGVRGSALGQLQGTAIDSHRLGMRIRQGKGQHARLGLLSPNLLPLLRRSWKRPQLQSWLFPGYRVPAPLTRMGIAQVCPQAGHTAKLTQALDPPWLRPSGATHRLAAGVALRRLPWLLGHASLRSTSLSLHVAAPTLHATQSPLDALALPADLENVP